jgi:tetratricopeptide (TPR) repeat protein
MGWAWYRYVLTSQLNADLTLEESAYLSARDHSLQTKKPSPSSPDQQTQNDGAVGPQRLATLLDDARSMIDRGQVREGAEILEGLVHKEPLNTQAMMELAMVYTLDYKVPLKARQLLERVVEINPNHRAALSELEILYAELGAQSEGLTWLQLKSEQHPDALELQFAYGRMLASRDPEAAIPWLVKATQIPDEQEHAYNELATAALRSGKVGMAIEAWTQALLLAEDDLEKAKAAGDQAIDILEDRIAVTKSMIHEAKKQMHN